MPYLLALDQGTSSSRSIVFDENGRIVALAQQELPQRYPRPGWVEHDPMEIWRGQLATARQALAEAGLKASDISALGLANQRETTLVWHRKTGQPIHPAIVWQDRRTEALCAELREQGREALIQSRTGLLIDAYFSATKLKWLLDHVPGARASRARRTGFRHHRQLAAVAAHGGRGACHRRQQCVANDALQCAHQPVGCAIAGAA